MDLVSQDPLNEKVIIDSLGRQGDGIAKASGGNIFVPFTLAGETVLVSRAGEKRVLADIITASPHRIAPACGHFGICGGCQLQHFETEHYLEWKRGLVTEAMAREGIATRIEPVISFGAHSRRKVVFTAMRAENRMLLGFSQKHTNKIADISQCPVLQATIEMRLADFRALCMLLAPKKGVMKLTVLACDNGLDVACDNGGFSPEKARQAAITQAGRMGFARLSLNGEALVTFKHPVLHIGKASVMPPPEAFVQAVAGAEQTMAGLVVAHLKDAKQTADLFSGFGAFGLRMAENSSVYAADSSGAAIAALDRAWRETGGGLKTIIAEKRDLSRRPLMTGELKKMQGVVFDPPRAGAEEQARELAKSKVARIAAVSCNPASLARDLRLLLDGGYNLLSITPIDQFVFTPHVECVALLER